MTNRQVELVVRRPGQPEWRRILTQGVTQMGRAEDNDLVLPDIGVSRRHARIVVDRDQVRIEDMGSGNGTFFHGRRVESQALSEGDEVVIDPFTLVFHLQGEAAPVEDDETMRAEAEEGAGVQLVVLAGHRLAPSYPLLASGLGLGRSPAQDIVLFDPAASRDHARIEARADGIWLFDRGSANGTYINGERVTGSLRLQANDHMRIGATEFRLEVGAAQAAPAPAAYAPPPQAVAPPPAAPAYAPPPQAPAPQPAAPQAQRPVTPPHTVMAPAPAPVYAAPPPSAPPAAAPAPAPAAAKPRSLMVPLLIASAIGAVFIFGLVGVGLLVATQMGDGDLLAKLQGAPAAGEVPALHQTPTEKIDEFERLMADGAQAKAQGRVIDAVTRYYKISQDVDPLSVEAHRRGFEACELIAFAELRNDARGKSLDDKARKQLVKEAVAAAAEAERSRTGAHAARVLVEAALAVVPGDKDLLGARGRLNKLVNDDRGSDEGKSLISKVDGQLRAAREAQARGDWAAAKAAYEAAIAADPELRTAGVFRAQEGLAQAALRAQ